ncbi:hypothetical protein ACFQ6E_13650 [Streptomyces sp. NPDC056462]|uniref:hypothetical protein n=1 Tax=Streptomyces sp. NPDC056462 TaxID=3345826 RepID=UPI0036C8AB0E
MRAPRTLRTALIATGVTAALGVSAAGAFAVDAASTPTDRPVAHQTKTKRVHVKTVKLADKVSRAKVYKTGKNRYEAELWAEGAQYGSLYTQGRPAYAQNNGLHVTLHPNGKVTSWVQQAKPKPKSVTKRVLVAAPTLADGKTKAKLYKLTDNHYEADLHAGAAHLDTLVANGHAAHGEDNGLHVSLQPDGELRSWLDGH